MTRHWLRFQLTSSVQFLKTKLGFTLFGSWNVPRVLEFVFVMLRNKSRKNCRKNSDSRNGKVT